MDFKRHLSLLLLLTLRTDHKRSVEYGWGRFGGTWPPLNWKLLLTDRPTALPPFAAFYPHHPHYYPTTTWPPYCLTHMSLYAPCQRLVSRPNVKWTVQFTRLVGPSRSHIFTFITFRPRLTTSLPTIAALIHSLLIIDCRMSICRVSNFLPLGNHRFITFITIILDTKTHTIL